MFDRNFNNNSDFPNFLHEPVNIVAQKLLGCIIEREIDGHVVTVRIVETESYNQNDEASHAYSGKRQRNAVMFAGAGHLYVYFTYGMHYCCNVVTGRVDSGSAVLIRAVEPLIGTQLLEDRRGMTGVSVTNGPAKLCKALGIDLSLNGHNLNNSPLRLLSGGLRPDEIISKSPRIGISKAKDAELRYYIDKNPYVSR